MLGVFSGAYSDMSIAPDGTNHNEAGTITLTINSAGTPTAMSAPISGTVQITGYAGLNATLTYQLGFETQGSSGAVSISVQAEDDTIDMGDPGFVSIDGTFQGNSLLVQSYNVNGIGGYSTATPDPNVVLNPGGPPPPTSHTAAVTLDQIAKIVPPPTAPIRPSKAAPTVLQQFVQKLDAYNKAIASYDHIANDLVAYLNSTEATQTYQINTPQRRAAFIGQVAEDTAGLTKLTEDTGPPASARSRFKGRGLLQLTGKANYAAASKGLGLGNLLVSFPELVASKDSYAERTAGFFWNSNQLNSLADNWNIGGITRRVAGPKMPGAAKRLALSLRALKVLNGLSVGAGPVWHKR
jgi:putative chitinase